MSNKFKYNLLTSQVRTPLEKLIVAQLNIIALSFIDPKVHCPIHKSPPLDLNTFSTFYIPFHTILSFAPRSPKRHIPLKFYDQMSVRYIDLCIVF